MKNQVFLSIKSDIIDWFWCLIGLNDHIDLPDKIGLFVASGWLPKMELNFSYLHIHSFNHNLIVTESKKNSLGSHDSIQEISSHFKQN